MIWAVMVTVASLLMYLVLGALVSRARGMFNVPAPASTGAPQFERIFRVHQNMAEQLILFLPGLWMFSFFVSDLWAGLLGLMFLVGRGLYAMAYFADASRRSLGFVIAVLASVILLLGSAIGALFGG